MEAILLGKSDAVKAVMVTLCKHEEDTLMSQVDVSIFCKKYVMNAYQ